MSVNTTVLKEMSSAGGGPIPEDQLQLLHDFQGFIAYGVREGLSFNVILGMLRHDIEGLVTKAPGFLPRIKGMHAELEQMANDPAVQREMRQVEEEFASLEAKNN